MVGLFALVVTPCAVASNVFLVDLGVNSGANSLFLNNNGDVAGRLDLTGGTHAFFYSGLTGINTDLGPLLPTNSYVTGLSGNGKVAITATGTTGPTGYIYDGTNVIGLGNLGGWNLTRGVNDAGTVVGQGYQASNTGSHPYLEVSSSYGTPRDLSTLTLGGSQGEADYINNNGQIAGKSNLPGDGISQAYYSADGTSIVSLHLGATNSTFRSSTTGMNASGQVIGSGALGSGFSPVQHGFVYTPGDTQATDLGTLNNFAGSSDAEGINAAGNVVGQSDIASNQHHAYLDVLVGSTWVMTDLGTLNGGLGNSTATAINDYGQIVGTASTASGTSPFLYMNGKMIDLNTLLPSDSIFTRLVSATSINNSGVIIGQGMIGSVSHAYVLSYSGFTVPEPSTVLSALTGFALFAWRFRRRK